MHAYEDRPGFYAENLLLYTPQAQAEGLLPIPIGKDHQFPPIAIKVGATLNIKIEANLVQDVAELAAHVLTSKGKHGFSDRHRGQLMTMTGELSSLETFDSQSHQLYRTHVSHRR